MPLTLENELAHRIIGFSIEIHKTLGPGLKTAVYQQCLLYELEQAGIQTQTNVNIPADYKTLRIEKAYDIDILVDEKVVLLIEKSDSLGEYHVQKLLRFLKHGNYKLGLLVNFNSTLLKDGIRRVTNNKLLEKEMGTLPGITSSQNM